MNTIEILGATLHNLKNLDVRIVDSLAIVEKNLLLSQYFIRNSEEREEEKAGRTHLVRYDFRPALKQLNSSYFTFYEASTILRSSASDLSV